MSSVVADATEAIPPSPAKEPEVIELPPVNNHEAVNLLSLDGGGVRGVSSLVILDGIMMNIQEMYKLPEVPKPCEFFHMIAGTSTGGLIAIMLGRLRMSTKEALEEYDNCSAKIFSSANRKKWSLSERFRATALQEVVRDIVKKRGMEDRMWDEGHPQKGKALVCVMPANDIGAPRWVRSFPGDHGTDTQWDRNITISEAARATTAASSFFKPQILGMGPDAQAYIDAAIGVNNPVDYLLKEAVDEFGSARRLGCVVSIGTGTRDLRLERASTGLRNWMRAPAYYWKLLKTLKSTATDGEETHRRLLNRLLSFPDAYYRFNVPSAAEQVELHHYKKLPQLKSLTGEYLNQDEITRQIRQVAAALKTDKFDHGLTLGHICSLDKDQLLLSNLNAQSIWSTTRFFTGRQDYLDRLDSFFSARDTGCKPRREFLLYGMGGIGKTEIALKIAENLRERFQYVFFIDGSSPATILQSYANIAKQHLVTVGLETDSAVRRSEAMQWISGLREDWLMVFDDCNLSDRQGHLPARDKGSIIYTSRSTSLGDELPSECILEVTPFREADAIELLLKASGSGNVPTEAQDMTSARRIVQELECLPLAVEQAAASIKHGEMSLHEYLDKVQTQKVRTLSDPRFQDQHVENPTVYTTLELSYEAIMSLKRRAGRSEVGRRAAVALKVLNLLAFYHHKEFPVSALGRAARQRREWNIDNVYPLSEILDPHDSDYDSFFELDKDGGWNSTFFAAGVRVLQSFSLAKVSPDQRMISMHVLVHDWARHRMDRETRLRQGLLSKVVIIDAIAVGLRPFDHFISFQMWPHLYECFGHDVKPLENESYLARLLFKLGWFFQLVGYRDEAGRCLLQCLHYWRFAQGNHGWDVLNTLERLGLLYQEMGLLGEAELAFLEILERLKGREKDRSAFLDDLRASNLAKQETGHQSAPSKISWKSPEYFKRTLSKPLFGALLKHLQKTEATARPGALEISGTSPFARTKHPDGTDVDLLTLREYILVCHAKLAEVYMDQGRYGMGKRMFLQSVEYLAASQPPEEKYEPGFLSLQIRAKSLSEPGNSEFWDEFSEEMLGLTGKDRETFLQSFNYSEFAAAFANYFLLDNEPKSAYQLYDNLHDQSLAPWQGIYSYKALRVTRRMIDCLIIMGGKAPLDLAVMLGRVCVRRAKRGYGEWHKETALSLQKLYQATYAQRFEYDEECEAPLNAALTRAEVALGRTHPITEGIRDTLAVHRRNAEKSSAQLSSASGTSKKNPTVECIWQASKDNLEKLKGALGTDHFGVTRFSSLVGDAPPQTREELVERLVACVGSNHSVTKLLTEKLKAEKDAPAQTAECDEKGESAGPHDGLAQIDRIDWAFRGNGTTAPSYKLDPGPNQKVSDMNQTRARDIMVWSEPFYWMSTRSLANPTLGTRAEWESRRVPPFNRSAADVYRVAKGGAAIYRGLYDGIPY